MWVANGCIIGKVRLGRAARAGTVRHPWAEQVGFGSEAWSYVVEAAAEFVEPILGIRGQLGTWYVKDSAKMDAIVAALPAAIYLQFPDVFPDLRDARPRDCKKGSFRKWKRKPRRQL